jgi:hypothetical protein
VDLEYSFTLNLAIHLDAACTQNMTAREYMLRRIRETARTKSIFMEILGSVLGHLIVKRNQTLILVYGRSGYIMIFAVLRSSNKFIHEIL